MTMDVSKIYLKSTAKGRSSRVGLGIAMREKINETKISWVRPLPGMGNLQKKLRDPEFFACSVLQSWASISINLPCCKSVRRRFKDLKGKKS